MVTTNSTTSTGSAATATTALLNAKASSSTASAASVGQSILTSLNANGSGIDTGALVTNLTAAQKSSLENPITAKQTGNAAQISAAASISNDLTTFSQALGTLASGGTLQTQPISTDSSVLAVAPVAGLPVGALSGQVVINQIAQAQTIKSHAWTGSQLFNTGTLSLAVGDSAPVTIAIDASNNTPAGIAQAINAKAAGVTANVITGSDGSASLVLKGRVGAAGAFTIAAVDDGSVSPPAGAQSLQAIAFDGSKTDGSASPGLSQTQGAQDASLTVDGVTVTRGSNSFSDVIPGVAMTLAKAGTVALGSNRPTEAVTQAVTNFVGAFNGLLSELNSATSAASSSSDAGPLRGDSAIRTLKDQLAKLTTTQLNAKGSIRTLAEIGVKTARDGSISLDNTILHSMLSRYPDDVEAMFATSQSSSSAKVLLSGTAGAARSGIYQVTNLSSAVAGGDATGSINGVAMSAHSWNLTAVPGNQADGLKLQILSGAPATATITVNQGLGGALQLIHDTLLGTDGALTGLSSGLTAQKKSLADALTKADAEVTVYHDRLVKKFSGMNTRVSGYKATQSYLTQQINLWTKTTSY